MAEPLDTPLHCGHYRIVSCIGSGAMGVVYEAVDTRVGRSVALKRLHPHIACRPGAQARFLLEGQAAARIRHPHVVEVLALGNEDSGPFLAMELLEGRNLAAVLDSRERLSVSEALETVLPVIAAVAAAHDAQVIHRDLKPSNVFLARGPGGQLWPKVVDFGVSAILEGNASTLTLSSQEGVVGTIAYLPPEQASGESGGSFAGDQYALAVLLYECVTGVRPFSGSSPYQVLSAILSSPARAMSRNPRDRFPSIRAFGAALLALASERARDSCSSELLEAPQAAADSRVRKTLRRKTAVVAAVTDTVDSVRGPAVSAAQPPKTGSALLQSYDGVAVARRGDTALVLWKAPARIRRSRWLFDGLDRMVAEEPDGILVLMIILPTSAPPDRATSVENAVRVLKLRAAVRRAVVVIAGDSAWQKVAKGVMRAFMPWTPSRLAFASTAERGIAKLLEAAGRKTPNKAAIERDLHALYAELDPTLVSEG